MHAVPPLQKHTPKENSVGTLAMSPSALPTAVAASMFWPAPSLRPLEEAAASVLDSTSLMTLRGQRKEQGEKDGEDGRDEH